MPCITFQGTYAGETGTGKELVAREIHDHSRRRDKCLYAINCGAASREVLLSELFGHLKGAFNGAIEDKAGVFEAAEDGTVLLDGISSLPLDVQSDLLAILKDRKVQRMGENTLMYACPAWGAYSEAPFLLPNQ